ncbi:MAG: class I SAM-dependent methyltransferase [Myxococcota bacterium]
MNAGEPSHTAIQVAASRAAHLRFDPPPHLLEDRIAEQLLGEDAERLIASYGRGAPWILLENRLFLPFRGRFGEERIAEAHAAGVRQLVILGAGLDSFAFRRPATLAGLRVFEVDHPATQGWKRARLAASGIREPVDLEFVECDFEATSVSAALRASSFRPGEPAIVSWMGVVYYLARETVERALEELAGLLAPGSAVVLDYQFPLEDLPQRYRDVFAQQSAYLQRAGEPQVNRYRPEELRQAILAAGFARAELPTREELRRRYFEPLGSSIPMSERFGMAIAWR